MKDIEQFLLKIQSVIGAKVIVDSHGDIEEIHIVSDLRRSPKQILRDVEAILLSEFDTRIDYKKVSIAQVKGDSVKTDQDPRLKLKTIEYSNFGASMDVSVILEKYDGQYASTVSGIKTSSNVMRLTGTATLRAIEEYLGKHEVFVFEDSREIMLSGIRIVVVSIASISNRREELYIGTAQVTTDINEAVARATLDAINRQIVQLEN